MTFYSKASFFIGRKYKVQQRVYVHSFHSVPVINLLSQRSVSQCDFFFKSIDFVDTYSLYFYLKVTNLIFNVLLYKMFDI